MTDTRRQELERRFAKHSTARAKSTDPVDRRFHTHQRNKAFFELNKG